MKQKTIHDLSFCVQLVLWLECVFLFPWRAQTKRHCLTTSEFCSRKIYDSSCEHLRITAKTHQMRSWKVKDTSRPFNCSSLRRPECNAPSHSTLHSVRVTGLGCWQEKLLLHYHHHYCRLHPLMKPTAERNTLTQRGEEKWVHQSKL